MEYFVYFCNINVIKILGMEGILDMEFFGISVRWLLTFVIKGAIIYLVVRVLTGVTKYLFFRSLHKQRKIALDETKVSFMRRIIVTAIYIIGIAAFLSLIPGVTWLLDMVYRPKPGDRQSLHFTFRTLCRYIAHRRDALSGLPAAGNGQSGPAGESFAFFGERDHYRRSGIVSIRTWRKYFGEGTWATYPGTHFMEEEYVLSLLIPKIVSVLVLMQDGSPVHP